MKDIDVTTLELGALSTNCYIICDKKTKAAVIVDPADNCDMIRAGCASAGVKPGAVLLTHGHYDHTGAASAVRDAFGIPVYAAADEKKLLSDAAFNGSSRFGAGYTLAADKWLKGGDFFDIDGLGVETIHTPGHTAGSVCYYFKEGRILISGDTLFRGSFGRTDFPTGDFTAIAHSIKDTLFALPDDVAVYPGHGAKTTIAHEKKHNMILTYRR